MQDDVAREALGKHMEALLGSFDAAAANVAAMPDIEERAEGWRELATLLVGTPAQFRATAYRNHPELKSAPPFPDTRLSAADQEMISRLDQSDYEAIDRALVENSSSSWRKMSRVIGGAMVSLEVRIPSLPLGLYVQRTAMLVESGVLLAQGDIDFMRLGEVRLPASVEEAERVT